MRKFYHAYLQSSCAGNASGMQRSLFCRNVNVNVLSCLNRTCAQWAIWILFRRVFGVPMLFIAPVYAAVHGQVNRITAKLNVLRLNRYRLRSMCHRFVLLRLPRIAAARSNSAFHPSCVCAENSCYSLSLCLYYGCNYYSVSFTTCSLFTASAFADDLRAPMILSFACNWRTKHRHFL